MLPFSLKHPTKILEYIEEWRGLDLRKCTDDEIDSRFRDFLDSIDQHWVDSQETTPFQLWRIRRATELVNDVSHFWAPPTNCAIMGRCNKEGQSLLYVSKEINTPFEELAIEMGEQAYLIEYKAKSTLNLKRVVSKDFIATTIDGEHIYDEVSMISYQILREFIRSEFLKPVGKGTEYLHRISGAICRVWFGDGEFDGWLYPSVQANDKYNIALKADSALEKLDITQVRIVRRIDKTEALKKYDISESVMPVFNRARGVYEAFYEAHFQGTKIRWEPTEDVRGFF